jgi:cyclopropane-fatty-acyl-phospholipid synthase
MKQHHVQAFPLSAFSNEQAPGASGALDRWVLARIQAGVPGARLRFVLWDGFERPPSTAPALATIVFRNRHALLSWIWDPELNFGEAYMFGAVEIHGDLVGALEEIYRAWPEVRRRSWRLPRANGVAAARENVHRHYDLGNAFYQLWLDREMVYTCAYFQTPANTLEEAQVAKMDRVCRKLQLKPGDRVIEAGCGWGALALFMATQYGASVTAFNVSTEQIAYARQRAAALGCDRVRFVQDDYRNVAGSYDAFVSVGMLEHVGASEYATLGQVIDRSLTDRGRGLLHFIGRNQSMPLNAWIRKRIFPGAYTPTLGEVCDAVLEPQNLSVLDVENLRLHYAKTLEHWAGRFEAETGRIARMFDETFVRAWRLYLAGSQAAFAAGSMQLFQVLFARGDSNAIPWTRDLVAR